MNLSYAAGFIDADGSIGFFMEYGSPRVAMSASQNSHEVLDQLRDLLDIGQVYSRPAGVFVWRASGFKILPVVRSLLPFIIVKRQQALRVEEFILCRQQAPRTPVDAHCLALVAANKYIPVNKFLTEGKQSA